MDIFHLALLKETLCFGSGAVWNCLWAPLDGADLYTFRLYKLTPCKGPMIHYFSSWRRQSKILKDCVSFNQNKRMKKFNIRGGLWTFVRLSPKNDIIFGEASPPGRRQYAFFLRWSCQCLLSRILHRWQRTAWYNWNRSLMKQQWRTQEFFSGGGFNKFSWRQRAERTGIWGR